MTDHHSQPTKPLNFQDMIARLHEFWASRGALIWQPYNVQVGAGTGNPATSLRVLGPEPWRVGYVEPSIRPDDARYGENPNRMQMHHQYQVILKPDPGDPQQMYLDSLRAIGIDPLEHDIRFVEDNWESPALGAWGLGWEVWLNGLEITQFTYFQEAGGTRLDPVSVEITYGLDRIAMAIQGARHFKDICWNDMISVGDVNLRPEFEHSTYYLDVADVETHLRLFEVYAQQAEHCLKHNLIFPAHDYVLRMSHTFNILDARGAIGVTDRTRYFGRMRQLSREVAQAYLREREAQGYPLLRLMGDYLPAPAPLPAEGGPAPTEPADFVLEIGTEELPPQDLQGALDQLKAAFPRLLSEARLDYTRLDVLGTPRRVAVCIKGLADRQPDREVEVFGPPAQVAFKDGQPTPALTGFARAQGVAPEAVQVRDREGKRYAAVVKTETGRPASEVLSEALPKLIAGLSFGKAMRWNPSNVAFSRPVRWLVALHGRAVVPFEYAGLQAGATTRGLRPQGSPDLPIAQAEDYGKVMRATGIVLDPAERRQMILEQARKSAAEVGGVISDDPGLLDEVVHLVEQPVAVRGSFEKEYLDLPQDVLITVMRKHQRYFAVLRDEGRRTKDGGQTAEHPSSVVRPSSLLPYFIAIANGNAAHAENIRFGNEAVVRARFADAAYFVKRDRQHRLEEFVPQLERITVHAKLGSLLAKTERLARLAESFGPAFGLSEQETQWLKRAARLSKADVATQMGTELTGLQGAIGRDYARSDGEPEAVALAIYEQYLPKSATDKLPGSPVGFALSVADRLDALVGMFAVGQQPTATQDPLGLRRTALGLARLLAEGRRKTDDGGRATEVDDGRGAVSLTQLIAEAAAVQPVAVDKVAQTAVRDFILARLEQWLRDQGGRYDLVQAVLAAQRDNPAGVVQGLQQLTAWTQQSEWSAFLTAYARCVRLVRSHTETFPLDPARFVHDAERGLYAALQVVEGQFDGANSLDQVFTAMQSLVAPINTFFDAVLVEDKDADVRTNRRALLQRIARLPMSLVDLSKVEEF
ncbi:MAG: glycine--tRNA ligase subunit beta [Anaerolineae bacterium]|nr:glycine--tRNA ligase subunit beta [Anaerolineae bacterium]